MRAAAVLKSALAWKHAASRMSALRVVDAGGAAAADVRASVGAGATNAAIDVALGAGSGAVDVAAGANVSAGPASVDVSAATNVDLGAGSVDVGAGAAIAAVRPAWTRR